jgi:hypothetical protein
MNDVRWSDAELRKFVDDESHVTWFSDATDREDARARFRVEARARIAPAVQAMILSRVGVLTDPEGITLVATDLALDLCCEDDVRRWLMVSTQPWDFLIGWIAREIGKSYRATAGKKRPNDALLKEIERANQ